ncbi:MAG: MoxR family ATPase [Deltaproteobacteria bacterium]|nr:MoxR family ATPase [Deltaproteobacteria bacterium]MBI3293289.1 MoxR family ATPase [Deltaproteobacteria bacterium]
MTKVIGRKSELDRIERAILLGRNILLEGPVGVGKTFLVLEILRKMKRSFERVDGDTRYSEQKLTGWFDPPIVLKKGYIKEAFVDGPLSIAMKKGGVLFVNELNRMPEAVQNILLPAMDERLITIPKLGSAHAKEGFLVIATQNPREFTATHALSEALMDRFEMVRLDYQPRDEELEILSMAWPKGTPHKEETLDLVRGTRQHPMIKRGASIRAAIAVGRLLQGGMDIETALLMALPGRIELVSSDEDAAQIIFSLFKNPQSIQKKKGQI